MTWRLLFIFHIIISFGASISSAEAICESEADDPEGDVQIYLAPGVSVPYERGELDIIHYSGVLSNDSLLLSLTLSKSPLETPNEYFRYWLGFDVWVPGEGREYMDVRVAGTATYDEGHVVGPRSTGYERILDLPIQWNGTTLLVKVPRTPVEGALGASLQTGPLRAQADGVHKTQQFQGPSWSVPYAQDAAYSPGYFEDDFRVLESCTPPIASSPSAEPIAPNETHWPVWVLLLAVAFAASHMPPRLGRR